ncbi:hypothetical protein PGR6_24900 [Pseudomonas sp. GR 6-02]|nr:hypothetical protein PGR6_24900 [Pseudomonas sp. GR 6-02]
MDVRPAPRIEARQRIQGQYGTRHRGRKCTFQSQDCTFQRQRSNHSAHT